MNKALKTSIALGMFALVGGVVAAQSGNDLFQQALVKERTDANLTEVIALYERIVQQHGADRKLAAKALYQIGQAHEKLGHAEARKAYERIAREFADQKDVAEDAGRRLAAMGAGLGESSDQQRRVQTPGSFAVTVSPDGRWMTATAWYGDDNYLVVHDTTMGETRRLLAASCGNPCTYSDGAVLSPDTTLVAFAWSDVAENEGREQLRVIPNQMGAAPKVLVRNAEFQIFPRAWSLDSKSILATLTDRNRTAQLGWVSVADGGLKIIKSFEQRLPTADGISLSPDGRHIAYVKLATNPSKEARITTDRTSHIYVLAADGSSEVALVKTAGANKFPLWTPDGSHVIFISDVSGKTDLWAIAVREGKAAGSPALLRRDIGEIRSIGITKNGTFYYRGATQTSPEQVYVAELSPGGGSRIVEHFVGMNPSWSPDGKSLAFKRRRPRSDESFQIVVRSVETGQEVSYSRSNLAGDPPRWLHSGTELITILGPLDESRLQFVDLKGNTLGRTMPRSPSRAGFPVLSPDDKTLYIVSNDPNDRSGPWDRIIAVDIATGREREVIRFDRDAVEGQAPIGLTLSPDGKTLAYSIGDRKTSERRLARIDIDGGNHRDLYAHYRVGPGLPRYGLVWTKDSRSLFFAMSGESDSQTRIMRISSEGGTPEFTGLTIGGLSTFDVSPDGSRIAYSTNRRVLSSANGVYAIDNLPALLNGAK